MKEMNNSITITVPNLPDGYRVEQYFSKSMINRARPEKSIVPGSTIIVMPVSGRFIEWGETYCLYFNDFIEVRRLMPGDDEDHIKGVSTNEEEGFLPVQYPKSEIKGLGKVIGIVDVRSF